MQRIEVEPGDMETVAGELSASVEVAREVKKHHGRMVGSADSCGHPIMQFALAAFLDRWSYGCGCLVSDADDMAVSLRRAGTIYVHVDESVARHAG
jgi:hypothetical protein